jgi:hypothetical protein
MQITKTPINHVKRPPSFTLSQQNECPSKVKRKTPKELEHHQTIGEGQQVQKHPTETNHENEFFNRSKDKQYKHLPMLIQTNARSSFNSINYPANEIARINSSEHLTHTKVSRTITR